MTTATKGKNGQAKLAGDKYFNLIKHAADGIAILQDGVFKLVNTALIRISGYNKEELLGMPFTQILTPESQKLTLKRYQARIAGKEVPQIYEIKAITKDGKIRDIEINAALTEYEGRVADEIIVRDTTERKQAKEALQTERNKLQSVIDGMADGLSIQDKDFNIIYQNEPSRIGAGRDCLGEKCYQAYENRDKVCEGCPVEKAFKDGKSHAAERSHVSPSGEVTFWENTASPVRDAQGNIVSCLEITRDITERKKAEQALTDEATRRRILIDQSIDGIVVLDENAKVYEANQKFAEMLGYTPEEVRELHTWDWDTQWSREELLEMGRKVDETGLHVETYHRRKDGTTIDVDISINGAVCSGQKLIFCVCRDITERKKAEEALQTEKNKLSSIIDAMEDHLTIRDTGYNLTYQSELAKQFIGDHLGEKCYRVYEGRDKICRGCPVEKAFKDGKSHTSERKVKLPPGETTFWENTASPIRDSNGNIVSCLEIARDITERKKKEQLQKSENYVLTLLGQGAELNNILDAIVRFGEQNDPSIIGSVLIFDPSKKQLFLASATNLPDDYQELFENGIPIGPIAGSCGTAAYLKERVIITDIANSPLFKPFEEVVKRTVNNGLLAVWSQPIISSNGDLLGTIANYGNKLGEPSADNLRVLEWSARIAAIAIERKKAEQQLQEKHEQLDSQNEELRTINEELQATEEELQNSQERLERMFESVTDGISVINLNGIITKVNERSVQMHGFASEDDMLGRNAFDLVAPQDHERIAADIRKALKEGLSRGGEYTMLRVDGSEFPGELSTSVLKDGRGNVIGHISIARDITYRKQMEELFKTVTNSSPVGIYILQNGKFQLANPQFQKLTGYSEEELAKIDPMTLVLPEDRDKVRKKAISMLKGELPSPYQFRVRNKAGDTRWVIETVTSIPYRGRRATLGNYIDITERKQAEERENQLQQELNLAGRLASIGQLAAGVAHEINNPLTGVIGFSHLMLSRDIPDDMKQDLQVIHSEAQRVAKIVENLLVFAHQRKTGREYLAINDIITRVLELRAYEMKVNNIEVETQLTPDLPATIADAGQLQQVFLNIILNAEYFMTKGHNKGKLLVKTERIDGKIRASFTDDGAGISKENLDKIFNPFFTTKEVGKGTGLGLSICHGIITQHQGRIYAESELGKGATFVIELPIVAEPAQAGKARVTKKELQKPRGAKILVVDDEAAILTFLHRLLTDMGHSVETINNADTALERLNTERYSLILLDIKLPGMSGIELYQQIEKIAPALTRRVMFITGDVMEGTTRSFLEEAGVPHITKPIDIEELKKMMNNALNQTQGAPTASG